MPVLSAYFPAMTGRMANTRCCGQPCLVIHHFQPEKNGEKMGDFEILLGSRFLFFFFHVVIFPKK